MRKAGWLLLLLCTCCRMTPDDMPHEAPAPPSAVPDDTLAFTDRVWVRADTTGAPGSMRIFLSDGTLVHDSCWETYRLSAWTLEADSLVRWQEDTMTIRAEILTADAANLVLRVNLVDGEHEEHYRVATVPYVCSDMPR